VNPQTFRLTGVVCGRKFHGGGKMRKRDWIDVALFAVAIIAVLWWATL
jgi:hypothetical protein